MKIYRIYDTYYEIVESNGCRSCCFYIKKNVQCNRNFSPCRAINKECYKEIKGHRNILNILCGLRIIKHIKN